MRRRFRRGGVRRALQARADAGQGSGRGVFAGRCCLFGDQSPVSKPSCRELDPRRPAASRQEPSPKEQFGSTRLSAAARTAFETQPGARANSGVGK